MKIIKSQTSKFFGAAFLGVAILAIGWALASASGQTPPGLSISVSNTIVSLTVTNGLTNGSYQLYFTEDVANPDWILVENGSPGQTNFIEDVGDLEIGFFKAVNNNSFTPPTITVFIQSPANGSVIQ